MKKFPFSKKAANVMLAAALVATPFAATVPMADSAAFAQQPSLKSVIDQRLDQGNVNTTAIQLSRDLASLTLATTREELTNAITTLQSETNEAAIAAVFGQGITSNDLMEAVALTFQSIQNLHGDKSKEQFIQYVGQIGYENFWKEVIEKAIADHAEKVGRLNTSMQSNIGVGLTGLLTVLIDLETEIGTFSLTAKQDFAGALFEVQHSTPLSENPTIEEFTSFVSNVYGKLSQSTIDILNHGKMNLVRLSDAQWEQILGEAPSPDPGTSPGGGTTPPSAPDPTPEPSPEPPQVPERDGVTIPAEEAITVEVVGNHAINRVNADVFAQIIADAQQIERVSLTITKGESQTGELVIPVTAFEALAEVNANAVVDVTTDEGSISLPVSELRDEALRTRLGVTEGDVELSISVNAVADSAERVAELGINAKSPIVEFSIVARSGDVEAPVNRFVQYLERDLVLSEDVNPDRTVVVRVNADGTLTVVPTIVRDGRVTFKSFTNSYYVAVEREASFSDLR
ncbi:hypothetical protein, partial [Halalkalibacterium ligniniphilum]|uniref:hypothetical protein n=1 Tax=Halalkalibacterium ligniniphilum TaxID=1134413 RepID=UPI000551E4E5